MTPWKWLRGVRVFLLAALSTASPIFAAQTATATINPAADAFVTFGANGSLAIRNFGSAGGLAIAGASGSPNGEFDSALRFDLSIARNTFNTQLGANQWDIRSVTLRLTATQDKNTIFDNTSPGPFHIFWMQNDSWTEGAGTPNTFTTTGITYNSLQTTVISASDEDLGTFSFNGSVAGATTYTLAITSGFDADLRTGNNVSFHLSPASGTMGYVFNSRNFVTAGNRPVLTITAAAVPEPATLALLAAGLAAVAARRTRARN